MLALREGYYKWQCDGSPTPILFFRKQNDQLIIIDWQLTRMLIKLTCVCVWFIAGGVCFLHHPIVLKFCYIDSDVAVVFQTLEPLTAGHNEYV